ncbi:MAG: TetR/AcrR family transcriptional regulator [Spirochaetales bacterium]|nr:TetR/AcrR family transcriptional regulator [Spirochaetales bacterium]
MSRDEQKSERRVKIIRAAKELFITKGLAGTSMSEIAKKIDLNVRTVYRYYKTKEELAFEIEIKIFEEMIEKLKTTSSIIKGKNGFEKISKLLTLTEKYYRSSENEIRFMGEFDYYFTGAYPYNALSDRFVEMMRTMDSPLRGYLKEGIIDGSIREDLDVPLTVETIENAMLALSQRIVSRGEHLEIEQEVPPAAMLTCLTNLLLNGIRNI